MVYVELSITAITSLSYSHTEMRKKYCLFEDRYKNNMAKKHHKT